MNKDKGFNQNQEDNKEKKKKKIFWLWFLLVLVLAISISAFGFITFSSSTTPSSSSATSNSSSTSTTPSSNSATPYSISYSYRTIQVQRFQHLSGGVVHSFGMTTSGELYAWGSNELGQLGDGTTANKSIPTLISFSGLQSGETIRDVFAGQYHTFVVTSNGRVYAWGFNNYGQLGDGTLVDNSTPTLISFPGGETIRNVAAGIGHSLAVTTTGQVYAWGSNLYGQLGDGTTANKSTPTLISFNGLNNLNDGETMRDVVAGGEYSHAVTTNGRVYSWGSNNRGQLGDGTSGTSQNQNIANKSTPTLISFDGPNGLNDGETIKNVDIGALHSVAVTTTGRAFGWGANSFNQLGDGTIVNKSSPTLISFTGLEGGETIRNVYLGNGHSLVVTTNNRLYAWGLNNSGQLGDGTSTNKQIPTLIILNGLSATIVNDYLTVNFGETITLPNPTSEGYVFAGWFMDEALTIPFNLTTMPANDVMLYASFIPAT
jgi:uncharacterized repeat protein (TIGR02543 family)